MNYIMTVEELIEKLEAYKGKGLYIRLYGGDYTSYEECGYAYLSVVKQQDKLDEGEIDIMDYDEDEIYRNSKGETV